MEEGSYILFAEVDFSPNPELIKSFVVGSYGVAKLDIKNNEEDVLDKMNFFIEMFKSLCEQGF